MKRIPLLLVFFAFVLLSTEGAKTQTFGPPVSVIITFSPKARERMVASDEHIAMSADYYGEPRRLSDLPREDNDGRLHAGEGRVTQPMSGYTAVTISGVRLNQSTLKKIKPPLKLNINVFSDTRSSKGNLLDCESFDDDVAVAAQDPVKITCKLIGE